MIEFGKSLRLAREAKGYTIAQLAEITRMAPKTVQELEEENISHIAAPIYGRGFVKLYCEAVGLEAKPFIDEFMAIYRGERDVGIRERVVHEPPTPNPQSAPESEPTTADYAASMPESAPLPGAAPMPEVAPITDSEPPPLGGLPIFREAPVPRGTTSTAAPAAAPEPRSAASLSRYAAPVRNERMPTLSPKIWRIGVLAAIAILLLWVLLLGVRALYRATSGSSAPQPETSAETPAEPAVAKTPAPQPAEPAKSDDKKDAKPEESAPAGAPRTPQSIPSIYID